MLRAAVLAALIATAYCGAKGSPQPPAREVPDAGPATPGPTPPPTSIAPSTSDAGSP